MYLWRKSIDRRWLHANQDSLAARFGPRFAVIERPDRKRVQLEIGCQNIGEARKLASEFGGQIEKLPRDWLKRLAHEQKRKPIEIGRRLVVISPQEKKEASNFPYSLIIPAGAAFGTGDHATTAMSLRFLEGISRKLKPGWSLVDLGTGSGILALAATCFGAKRVIAIDHDPLAIATARDNARANKIDNIDFQVADVRHWKFPRRADVVTANLFSELLIAIVPKLKIARQLVLSGILREQERRVRRALHANKIDIAEARRRGKWVAILAGHGGAS